MHLYHVHVQMNKMECYVLSIKIKFSIPDWHFGNAFANYI